MIDSNGLLLSLSAQIVAAHVGHNHTEATALPNVIRSVYNTLVGLQASILDLGSVHIADGIHHSLHLHHDGASHNHLHIENMQGQSHAKYVHPTYGQTVFNDRLICMEDGLSMKMLKRHLLTVHGMSPEEYRTKWELPDDYPMVASDYAQLRSNLAVQSGLGLKPEDRPGRGHKPRRA